MSIHEGHRERLKKRFQKEGLDHFAPHEVLELLLFYCIPRKDTNEIAHGLIKRFGTLPGVLNAPAAELCKVPGMGENAAAFLTLLKQLHRYYEVSNAQDGPLTDIDACGKYLLPKFSDQRNEVVYLLCLDAKCKVLDCIKVGEGSVNSAAVPIRRIVEMALGSNATSVVLAHNHPSGIAIPSHEDKFTTHRLALALRAVEIELVDHIVVADGDYVSFTLSGLYDSKEYSVLV